MNENVQRLLMLLGGIAIVLLAVILLFSNKSPFMRMIRGILDEDDGRSAPPPKKKKSGGKNNGDRPKSEVVILIRKSDDRLRIFEANGQVRLVDEYYELVFRTRNGQDLKIECSRNAYEQIPFNQQGAVLYKDNKLIKYKSYDGVVVN